MGTLCVHHEELAVGGLRSRGRRLLKRTQKPATTALVVALAAFVGRATSRLG